MIHTRTLTLVSILFSWSCSSGDFAGTSKQNKPSPVEDDSTVNEEPTPEPKVVEKDDEKLKTPTPTPTSDEKINLTFADGMSCSSPIEKGFRGKVYKLPVGIRSLPDFSKLTPLGQITALELNVAPRSFTSGFPSLGTLGVNLQEWFGIEFMSQLDVAADGLYWFKTNSDDGSKLYVDNKVVVDNDGTHAPTVKSGSTELKKGSFPLKVEWFQGPRKEIALQVYWKKPGASAFEIIPSTVTKHRKACGPTVGGSFP